MFLIHTPPEHAETVARAVVGACRLEGWQAVARGAACDTDLLLDVDFFQHANQPLQEMRARFAIQPKSPKILELDPFGAMKLPSDK